MSFLGQALLLTGFITSWMCFTLKQHKVNDGKILPWQSSYYAKC